MTTRQTIRAAMAATPETHAATLFGERKAGSKWGRAFSRDDWAALLPRWQRYEPPETVRQEGCTYLRTGIGDLFAGATLGAVPWAVVERAGLDGYCEAVTGSHGPELQLSRSCIYPGQLPLDGRATVATLILGPHEGADVVFTLHPGEPLAPWNGEHAWREGCEPGETTWDTTAVTAVKLT
jgi:hypothetical protein